MDKCVDDILSGCGVLTTNVTPGEAVLFDVRDAPRATELETKWFHTHVKEIMYLTNDRGLHTTRLAMEPIGTEDSGDLYEAV